MRGVFSTGVLDTFLRQGFNPFDIYLGVSAGAGNLAAFLANMPGRNLRLYCDYSRRPEFIRVTRFLRGGHLMDLDWLWERTIAEIRLDLDTIYAVGKPLLVCVTDVQTGKPVYLDTTAENLEHVLKASSALPILYRGRIEVNGRRMVDGGLSDPIPVNEAIRRGATRIMVIRSRPDDYFKRRGPGDHLAGLLLRRYPALCEQLAQRADHYNKTVSFLRNPPAGIRIIEVCPPTEFRPSRLSQDVRALFSGYRQGRRRGEAAIARWQHTFNG